MCIPTLCKNSNLLNLESDEDKDSTPKFKSKNSSVLEK